MGKPSLYMVYPGQLGPQSAHVEVNLEAKPDEAVSYGYNAEIGNAVPLAVWHHRVLRLGVSPSVDTEALDELLGSEEWQAQLATLLGDSRVEWDGNNHRGVTGAAADAAIANMAQLLDELPLIAVWSAQDWLEPVYRCDKTTGLVSLDGVVVTPANVEGVLRNYPDSDDWGDEAIYVWGLEDYIRGIAEGNAETLAEC